MLFDIVYNSGMFVFPVDASQQVNTTNTISKRRSKTSTSTNNESRSNEYTEGFNKRSSDVRHLRPLGPKPSTSNTRSVLSNKRIIQDEFVTAMIREKMKQKESETMERNVMLLQKDIDLDIVKRDRELLGFI